jgi:hypothetical protein
MLSLFSATRKARIFWKYALLVALIAIVAVAAVTAAGLKVDAIFKNIVTKLRSSPHTKNGAGLAPISRDRPAIPAARALLD